ncbi:MAG: class I SAM-dependent methyltransferase [Patescibacteria group bacterium]
MDHKQELLVAYRALAAERNMLAGDPKTWAPEAEHLATLLPAGSSVVDIGCGAGRDALLLAGMGYQYIGVDLSEPMLEQARRLAPGQRFIPGDMYALPMGDASFDGFWAAASLLHIPKAEMARVLTEIRRVIKPGGVGFIAVKEGVGEKVVSGPKPGSDRFFSFWQEDELAATLAANRFSVLSKNRRKLFPEDKTVWVLQFVRAV